jgi:hypothetical protein
VPSTRTKRALRACFSALLANAAALDFVDYTKGLDKVRPLFLLIIVLLVDFLLVVLFAADDSRARAGVAVSLAEHPHVTVGARTVGVKAR